MTVSGTKPTRRPSQGVSVHWCRQEVTGESGNDAIDPNVWSGRALQEVFVELSVCGLASMYPVSSWSCFAPDHHGYQRACVLIMRQASTGHSGPQCSHARGGRILLFF